MGAPATVKNARLERKEPSTICVDRDIRSGDHHEVQDHCHFHGRGRSSTEGTKCSLTSNNVDSEIKYCCNGSGRGDTPSTMMTAATPSMAPTTNGIEGGTTYHYNGIQHSSLHD